VLRRRNDLAEEPSVPLLQRRGVQVWFAVLAAALVMALPTWREF